MEKHVAIFLPSLRGGGAERVTVTLANALVARGHEVTLLTGIKSGPFLINVASAIKIVDLGANHVRSCIVPLACWLRRHQPSVLMSVMAHANLAAIVASRLSGSNHRLVLTLHSAPSNSLDAAPVAKKMVMNWATRRLYSRADAIVAVSQGVADNFASLYPTHENLLRVAYNPLDIQHNRIQAEELGEGARLTAGSSPVIVAVGRLSAEKDHATLLNAFARLRQSCDARLIILGEGDLRPALERRICELGLSDAITLPGYVDNPHAVVARASCFVLSSRWEGLPTVLIEAAAVGVPIVSTDCPSGPREILQGLEGAQLVPVGDAEAMARALENALAHSRPVAALMRRAEDFDVPRITDTYERILGLKD